MAVPYTFGTATAAIPLSNLDSNFATTITLGNTAIQLGNTVTTLNNMTLANVAVTSVSTAFPNNLLANSSVTLGNTTVALGGTATTLGNVTLTNATVSSLSTAITVAQGGTGLTSTPANGALDIGNGTGFTRATLTAGSGISITNGAGSISIATSGGTATSIANGTSNVSIATSGGNVVVATNGSTAVTVDTSQNVLVGTTTSYSSEKVTINQSTSSLGLSVRSGGSALGNYESSDTGHNAYWTFGRDNASTGNFVFGYGGTLRGSISNSTGVYTPSSDSRLKKNITNITYGLNEVMALRPVTYLMNEEADTAKKHLGFIAQEVKALLDEAVDDLIDPDTQFYMLDKAVLVPVLVKAMQEQQALIASLTARIVALEAK
jgi:Chaperone of endosialidase